MVWIDPNLDDIPEVLVQSISVEGRNADGFIIEEGKNGKPIRPYRRAVGLLVPTVQAPAIGVFKCSLECIRGFGQRRKSHTLVKRTFVQTYTSD